MQLLPNHENQLCRSQTVAPNRNDRDALDNRRSNFRDYCLGLLLRHAVCRVILGHPEDPDVLRYTPDTQEIVLSDKVLPLCNV